MHKTLYLIFCGIILFSCSSCREHTDSQVETSDSSMATVISLHSDEQGPAVLIEEPLLLQYRFSEDDSFGYQIGKMESISMFRDSLLEEKNDVTIRRWYKFRVLEAFPQGGGRLLVECDRLTYDGEYAGPSGNRELKYDSKEEQNPNIEKMLSEFTAPLGNPFEIVVTADGRIASVDKLEQVVRKYLGDDYATTKSNQIAAITRDYAQTGIKAILQLVFQKLPEKAVAEDSTWVIVSPQHLGYLSIRDEAVYSLNGVVTAGVGNLAHIGVRLKSIYTGKPTFDTGQGMATMQDFDIAGVGKTSFNLNKGRVHKRNIINSVYVNMYVEPPEELKSMVPDQARNHWWSQKAATEDSIEPYSP